MQTASSRLLAAASLVSAISLSSCGSSLSPVSIASFLQVGPSCATSDKASRGLVYSGASTVTFVQGMSILNSMEDPPEKSQPPLRIANHEIYIDTVSSTYKFTPDDGAGAVTLKPETHAAYVPVASAGGTSEFIAELLGPDNGNKLLQRSGNLVIAVTVSGKLPDGSRLTSAPAEFPVQFVATTPPCPTGTSVDASSCNPSQAAAYSCK